MQTAPIPNAPLQSHTGVALLAAPFAGVLRAWVARAKRVGRARLEHGVSRLVAEMRRCATPESLVLRTGIELDELFEPATCAIYLRGHGRFRPVFTRRTPGAPVAAADSRLMAQLETEPEALCTARADDRLVRELRAASLVPLRRNGWLGGFVALGAPRAGGSWAGHERALLLCLARQLAAELEQRQR